MQQSYTCPLCSSPGESFFSKQFQKCTGCQSIFRCPEYFITSDKEKARYEEHNNDIEDTRYQDFVRPMVGQILKNHNQGETGLDFGAGTGPVISHLLGQEGYKLSLYDPFFHNSPELFLQKYDFIIACEVVEHFHHPKKEFELLYNLLKPNGKIYIMTDLYNPKIDFGNWYYKNDKTHVFFYSDESLEVIKTQYGWTAYSREARCIVFEK